MKSLFYAGKHTDNQSYRSLWRLTDLQTTHVAVYYVRIQTTQSYRCFIQLNRPTTQSYSCFMQVNIQTLVNMPITLLFYAGKHTGGAVKRVSLAGRAERHRVCSKCQFCVCVLGGGGDIDHRRCVVGY